MTTLPRDLVSPYAPLLLDVRHNEVLRSFDALRKRARDVIDDAGLSQYDVADRLGVSQAAVSAALNDSEGKRVGTLKRIIEELTAYEVVREEVVTYRVLRKDAPRESDA